MTPCTVTQALSTLRREFGVVSRSYFLVVFDLFVLRPFRVLRATLDGHWINWSFYLDGESACCGCESAVVCKFSCCSSCSSILRFRLGFGKISIRFALALTVVPTSLVLVVLEFSHQKGLLNRRREPDRCETGNGYELGRQPQQSLSQKVTGHDRSEEPSPGDFLGLGSQKFQSLLAMLAVARVLQVSIKELGSIGNGRRE